MSGGSLDYQYLKIEYLTEDIDKRIEEGIEFHNNADRLNEEEKKEIVDGVKKLSADLKAVAQRARKLEWWLSGDDSDRNYLDSLTE